MRVAFLLFVLAIALGAAGTAQAHEIRPAFLQIREIDAVDLRRAVENAGARRSATGARCHPPTRLSQQRTAAIDTPSRGGRATMAQHLRRGLPGQQIVIENLETSLTDVILRFTPLLGPARTLRIDGAAPAVVIPTRQSRWDVAGSYFRLGVEHILFGIDHLLFVLCLLMLVDDLKRLLGAVTAFTVAHSITLAATTFNGLHLATAPVEACIALSIAFIAAEILKTGSGKVGITRRWPWLASFGFGLLHGFGFAAALRDIGLPEAAIPLALLFFNAGVEAGQILFIAAVLSGICWWRRYAPQPASWLRHAPAYAAGVVACFWFWERALHILM